MKRVISIRILIIDDSTVARKSIRENLRNFNIDFIDAADAHSGLSLAISSLPDLILLDLNLPDFHGFEILKKLRSYPATAHIPVIITTVSNSAKDVEEAQKSGAQSYLLKPVDSGILLSKIQKILNVTEEELTEKTLGSGQEHEAASKTGSQTSTFLKIESSELKEGMELGLPVLSPEGNILYKSSTVLDDGKIEEIRRQNIKILYIKPKV